MSRCREFRVQADLAEPIDGGRRRRAWKADFVRKHTRIAAEGRSRR